MLNVVFGNEQVALRVAVIGAQANCMCASNCNFVFCAWSGCFALLEVAVSGICYVAITVYSRLAAAIFRVALLSHGWVVCAREYVQSCLS